MVDVLPIDDALPALRAAIAARGMAVLQAPPGAGKTTRVPLDLLAAGLVKGRIVMLEPRRLAARAAAERMAETLGEAVGATVGYRIRGEAKVGPSTRIEVVTEGILTRMIQSDPELSGVGALIFDEFHERSLNADLGLALALEIRAALRDDLVLVVMSATLDAAPVAALMEDAPMVTSEGRAFPVETRWLGRSPDASLRYEASVAGLVAQAVEERLVLDRAHAVPDALGAATPLVNAANNSGPVYGNNTSGLSAGLQVEAGDDVVPLGQQRRHVTKQDAGLGKVRHQRNGCFEVGE